MPDTDAKPRRPPHWLAGILAAGTVLSGCGTSPPAPMVSDTIQTAAPENMQTSDGQLINEYKAAYRTFEESTTAALIEMEKIRKELSWSAIRESKGLNITFRPSIEGKPGECSIKAEKDDTVIANFPTVLAMFDEYCKLCRIQNKISPELAKLSKLPSPPNGTNIIEFLRDHTNDHSLSPDYFEPEKLAHKGNWLKGAFNNFLQYANVKNEFKVANETGFNNAFSSIGGVLKTMGQLREEDKRARSMVSIYTFNPRKIMAGLIEVPGVNIILVNPNYDPSKVPTIHSGRH